jgi:hypothetical protein
MAKMNRMTKHQQASNRGVIDTFTQHKMDVVYSVSFHLERKAFFFESEPAKKCIHRIKLIKSAIIPARRKIQQIAHRMTMLNLFFILADSFDLHNNRNF